MIDAEFPWHVGRSWQATQYHCADRETAERLLAEIAKVERGWAIRHHNDIIAAKNAAQKAS